MTASVLQFSAATVLLAGTLAIRLHFDHRTTLLSHTAPFAHVGQSIGDWTVSHTSELPASTLNRLVPTEHISRVYRKGKNQVAFLATYFANHRAGETMHSPKNCLPGSGWDIRSREEPVLRTDNATYRINKLVIQKQGERMLVFYWYQSAGRVIPSEYAGKFFLVTDSLLKGRNDAMLVRLIVPERADASEGALEFSRLLIPRLELGLSSVTSPRPLYTQP